jgi:hypothetical protein
MGTIFTLAIASSASPSKVEGGGLSSAGTASGSRNIILSKVEAVIKTASTFTAGRSVILTAMGDTSITTDAWSVSIGLAGGQGSCKSISDGISIVINDIKSTITAAIDDSTVNSDSSVELFALSANEIRTLTIA